MKKLIPFNPMPDGTCRTIKAQYGNSSLANFLRGGGTERQLLPSTKIVGTVWNSKQNGKIYDPAGISPCITAGPHGGVVPFIIEYEKN